MNRRRLPKDPDETASYGELKMYYTQAIEELTECHRQRRAIEGISKSRTKEARDAQAESKKVQRDLVTITRKQKAKEEGQKAGYWSGAAAICVTITYEIFKVAGFPGGAKWIEFWKHEAVYGVIMWIVTMVFAWIYKDLHPGSK